MCFGHTTVCNQISRSDIFWAHIADLSRARGIFAFDCCSTTSLTIKVYATSNLDIASPLNCRPKVTVTENRLKSRSLISVFNSVHLSRNIISWNKIKAKQLHHLIVDARTLWDLLLEKYLRRTVHLWMHQSDFFIVRFVSVGERT